MARKLKIMENEKHPLDYLKNDEITKKRELVGVRVQSLLRGVYGKPRKEIDFIETDY